MRSNSQKVIALGMAIVVFISTLSFTFGMHFCGDRLVTTSLSGSATSCGMEQDQSTSPAQCSFNQANCCRDIQVTAQGENDLKTSSDISFSAEHAKLAISFFCTYFNIFESTAGNNEFALNSPPNKAVKDIYILHSAFLI